MHRGGVVVAVAALVVVVATVAEWRLAGRFVPGLQAPFIVPAAWLGGGLPRSLSAWVRLAAAVAAVEVAAVAAREPWGGSAAVGMLVELALVGGEAAAAAVVWVPAS
ncbi:hypothetical protein V8C86DRAFT_2687758 [Haematococcus lacustris]